MAGFSGTPRADLNWTRTDLKSLDLSKLRVAVVGGTGGIGRAIALSLAARGASVTVVGQTFRDGGARGLTFMKADLSSMAEAGRLNSLNFAAVGLPRPNWTEGPNPSGNRSNAYGRGGQS